MTVLHRRAGRAGLAFALLMSLPVALHAQSPGPSRGNGLSTQQAIDARFGLAQAIETAEREGKGRAMEATFSPFSTGGGALEVTLMRPDASVTKYRIDANTGEVVNVSAQTLEGFTTSLDPAALQGVKLNMKDAVTVAEGFAKGGQAVGVSLEKRDDALVFEVSVLKDGAETSVVVSQDGKVEAD